MNIYCLNERCPAKIRNCHRVNAWHQTHSCLSSFTAWTPCKCIWWVTIIRSYKCGSVIISKALYVLYKCNCSIQTSNLVIDIVVRNWHLTSNCLIVWLQNQSTFIRCGCRIIKYIRRIIDIRVNICASFYSVRTSIIITIEV